MEKYIIKVANKPSERNHVVPKDHEDLFFFGKRGKFIGKAPTTYLVDQYGYANKYQARQYRKVLAERLPKLSDMWVREITVQQVTG